MSIKNIASQEFVFVDIETNGGNGPRGRIIEVAAIKVADGIVVDEFVSLVHPGSDIPRWITKLTGIKNEDVATAPYFQDIAEQLFRFMDNTIFVAHNVLFDYSFLRRQFEEAGKVFRPKLICTVKLSRRLYPNEIGHGLEAIIRRHNIAVDARHRALDDARAIYKFMQHAIDDRGADAVYDNIELQLKTRNVPPNVSDEVIRALPESHGVYIFEDDRGAPLYVGKSVNIRARVRSHFATATTIAKEMKMSLQSHNISYIQTDTELEALLLESEKIKELQPMFNRKLRRATNQTLLVKQLDDQGYTMIKIENHDLSKYANLSDVYGVYRSKRHAKARLEEIGRTYQLCPKLLGLEPNSKGLCFRYQLGLCKGACDGKESAEAYNARVDFALERSKIEDWPFRGPIALKISEYKSLIIDQWTVLGTMSHELDPAFSPMENKFDLDTYKILRSFIKTHRHSISLLPNGFNPIT